jgi:hypothetical protein
MNIELSEEKKQEIRQIRHDVVWTGKHSDKFKKLAATRDKDDPKYAELDNMEDTGAISDEDCYLLYSLVCQWRPETIVEIGTWFGTSAIIMARAMMDLGIDGKIYTCDKHDVYIGARPYSDLIKYNNLQSGAFLRNLRKKKIKADMFFVDAGLQREDGKQIRKLTSGKIRLAGHDYIDGAKGIRNANMMRRVFGTAKLRTHGICFILTNK